MGYILEVNVNRFIILLIVVGLNGFGCSHFKNEEHSAEKRERKAIAKLIAPEGSALKGNIHFREIDGKLHIESNVDGIKMGPHGFHIHEVGDCTAKDFSSAKGHFNPEQTSHGSHHGAPRHAGDLGNLVADNQDMVRSKVTIEGITLGEGPQSIVGRSVIIHEKEDDLKSQPAGNAGARIACGVVELLTSNAMD